MYMCSDPEVDTSYESTSSNVAVAEPETETPSTSKTYKVPSKKFTLTGKTLSEALSARFPNQDAREVECGPDHTLVWIGTTNDPSSDEGAYFEVETRKLNQHSNEYTLRPSRD